MFEDILTTNPLEIDNYEEKINQNKDKSNLNEAVITGQGNICGKRVCAAIMDSNFMMGSMGCAVGEKITRLVEYATKRELPLIIFTASGGARMQEGIISLMQMAKTTSAIAKLNEAGVKIEEDIDGIRVSCNKRPKAIDIKTLPYPGFPTDMQAQFMAMLTIADGTGLVTETVFENRFMHVDELKRMGACIKVDGRTSIVEGVPSLNGCQVKATDLRAGAAMVLAGLVANGETEVSYIHHIDRGYDNLVEKLCGLGADICRVDN